MGLKTRSGMARLTVTLAALAAAYAMVAYAFTISPRHGLDFSVYLTGGQSVLEAGGALYTKELEYREGSSLLFTYPPFSALMFAVLAPFGQNLGLNIFTGISLLVAAAAAVFGVRHAFRQPSVVAVLKHPWLRPLALAGFGFVVLLGPWRETMAFGQINILLFGLILADFLVKRDSWPRGLLTGVAAGLKLTPLVFGLYFLARRDWSGLRNMSFGFLATFGLGFLILPRESRTYWVDLLPNTSRIGGAQYVDNLGIKGAILHFAGPDFPVDLPWLLFSLLAVGAAALVIMLAGNRGDGFTAIAATALLMLLISPVSWSHHWVWVALFIPVLGRNLADYTRKGTGLRIAGICLLASSFVVFLLSPKVIGQLMGARDLDSQQPTLWLMASSVGVFWGLALLIWWVAALWSSRPARWWKQPALMKPLPVRLKDVRP